MTSSLAKQTSRKPLKFKYCTDQARSHYKLKWHAAKFEGSPCPNKVIARYAAFFESSKGGARLQHIIHLAAWVAFATPTCSQSTRDVARLLHKVLPTFRELQTSPRLQFALKLVKGRIDRLLVPKPHDPVWKQLCNALSTSWSGRHGSSSGVSHVRALGQHEDTCNSPVQWKIESVVQSQHVTLRAHREKQKLALARMQCLSEEEEEVRLAAIRSRVVAALGAWNPAEMTQIVLDAVVLLAPPRDKADSGIDSAGMPEVARQRLRSARQTRLRAMLIRLLHALDLEDDGTRKLLHVPMERIRFFLRDRDLHKLAARKQWVALSQVLGFFGGRAELEPKILLKGASSTCGKQHVVPNHLRSPYASHKSTCGGTYQPNRRIQLLKHVKKIEDDEKRLVCSKCDHELVSMWFFTGRAKRYVLMPINGHMACGGAAYRVADGSPGTKDQIQNLDLCEHLMKRVNCKLCGGTHLCIHGRQRNKCPDCRTGAGRGRPRIFGSTASSS